MNLERTLKLALMRHGEAGPHTKNDHSRSLTERGQTDTLSVGEKLARQGFTPDVIICSDALRTRQTLDQVLRSIAHSKVVYNHDIYLTTKLEKLLDIMITDADVNTDCLMLVGHNPTISQLSFHLTGHDLSFAPGDCQLLSAATENWVYAFASSRQWTESSWISP